jgi:hypothetical protein
MYKTLSKLKDVPKKFVQIQVTPKTKGESPQLMAFMMS